MALNPPGQYATESNLRARQRLWAQQQPPFDIVGWVLDIAGVTSAADGPVLDVGCGNGLYLAELRARGVEAAGVDLSVGMLSAAAAHPHLVNGDVTALPFATGAFRVVLAPHMLYHVPDRVSAVRELRRVTRDDGRCAVVTNGGDHMRSLRALVEHSVRTVTPDWEMRNPSTHAFSLENGDAQLRAGFDHVETVRPSGVAPVMITDAAIAADYVASVADHYGTETSRPWTEVVDEVREAVQADIDRTGAFVVTGDSGAFLCT